MAMRVHELHPSLVHAPLALLPAAAIVEALCAVHPRRRELDRLARTLWWATAGSGALAGLAGMAASQEIELDSDHARDLMFVHGAGNVGLVVSALGLALWRRRRRATATSAAAGLLAFGASLFTAYLGGELVYAHGAGIRRLGGLAAEAPALASRAAPGRLARDAARGLSWMVRRGARAASGRQRIDRGALAPVTSAGGGAVSPAAGP